MALFKYMAAKHWDVCLLQGRIRFTDPKLFNDPFELHPHFLGMMPAEELQGALRSGFDTQVVSEIEKILQGIPPEQREGFTAEALFQLVPPSLIDGLLGQAEQTMNGMFPVVQKRIVDEVSERIGVLCLSEVEDSLLMWAHYADSHTGFVIEFDESSSFFNQRQSDSDEFGFLRPIVYSDERPSLHLSELEATTIILTKSTEWAYEREWRMLLPIQNAVQVVPGTEPPVHLFSIPPSSIRRVILGCRMDIERVRAISFALRNNGSLSHVRVEQAQLHPRHFQLQFVEAS